MPATTNALVGYGMIASAVVTVTKNAIAGCTLRKLRWRSRSGGDVDVEECLIVDDIGAIIRPRFAAKLSLSLSRSLLKDAPNRNYPVLDALAEDRA